MFCATLFIEGSGIYSAPQNTGRIDLIGISLFSIVQLGVKKQYMRSNLIVGTHSFFDNTLCVEHTTCFSSTKRITNVVERRLGMPSGQVHRNLARKRDVCWTPLTGHIRKPDVEMLSYLSLYLVDGDRLFGFFLQNVTEEQFHDLFGHFTSAQGRE
jgi:hypothetical protein